MSTLAIHPLAELIPPMSDEEYAELRSDIETNGLRMPVTLYEEQVLDGRNRARACEELGVPVQTVPFMGDDPAGFVISLNLRRRNLTTGQRAMAALALLDYEKERAKERQAEAGRKAAPGRPAESSPQKAGTLPEREVRREAVNEAGGRLGVSGKSVERAARVAAESPELSERVKRGDVSLGAAHREVTGERTKREREEQKPAPEPKTERQKQIAAAAASRLDDAITQVGTLAKAVLDIDLSRAVAGADSEQVSYWRRMARDAAKNLRDFDRRLEENR